MQPLLRRYLISAVVVLTAILPFFLQGATRSAAGAPWLWAFLIEDLFAKPFLPASPILLFFATALLLAGGAFHRTTCVMITGWCVVNAIAAEVMNFQLYTLS